MKEANAFLMVNQAKVIDATCNACGERFAAKAGGEKALMLSLGDASQALFFCNSCGDNIISHLNTEEAVKRYEWDWAIPLRNGASNGKASAHTSNGTSQVQEQSI